MLSITFDREGINEYQKNLLKASEQLNNFEIRFITTLANMIIQKAMPRTPVDTGRLRRSYKVSKVKTVGKNVEITVYNDAKSGGVDLSYASYIEYGHVTRNRMSWVEGRFMLTLSTDQVKREMQRVWDILFNQWVKEMNI